MQLIYLSPVPWFSFAQRPHKFVEWFHTRSGGDVFWVDPYPTRFPIVGDLSRLGVQGSVRGLQMPQWLTVVRPKALPIEPLPASGWINGVFWKDILNDMERFVSNAPTLVAVGKPSVLALCVLKRLRGVRSLYDAMDDFPAFYVGLSRLAMATREGVLVRSTTRIFTSSTNLQQRWNGVRSDVQLVQNGLDADVLPRPKLDMIQRSRKILGYVGTVGRWFDWDWVIALAQARHGDSVRLIGPVFAPPPSQLPSNVELLSPCEHAAGLQAMLDFDVGLIPFKRNELTASIDPIKYYEYHALGLPIVSTCFGEMRVRTDEGGTFLSKDFKDIPDLIDEALTYRPDGEELGNFTARNSWDARFAATGIL